MRVVSASASTDPDAPSPSTDPDTKSPSLAFVVPTRNDEKNLPRLLRSLLAQGVRPSDVVIADGVSTDHTLEVAQRFGALFFSDPAGRGARINAAVRRFRPAYVIVLDADMEAGPGLVEELCALAGMAECLVIKEKSVAVNALSAARAFERELFHGDRSIEAARGCSSRLFWQAGGYPTDMEGVEEWVFGRTLAALVPPVHTVGYVLHHELQLTPAVVLRKYFVYGKGYYHLLKRDVRMFAEHANPARESVRAHWRTLARYPTKTGMLAVFKAMVYCAGLCGLAFAAVSDVAKSLRRLPQKP